VKTAWLRAAAWLLLSSVLACPSVHSADASARIMRVGYLGMGSPDTEIREEANFWKKLAPLGWIEGKNLVAVQVWAEGRVERLPSLVAQLLEQKVDLIITGGTPAAVEAKKATSTVPIVLVAYDRDPVASGVVDSLSRPGGNITGIFSRQIDLVGKRLELLKETLPDVSRIAVIHDPARPLAQRDLEAAAKHLDVRLYPVELRHPQQLDHAFNNAKGKGNAALVLFSPMFYANRAGIAAAAARARLPTMCQERDFVAAGALMSFAPDREEILRRVAYYVDRLLRGAKPADLPFEEASRFKLTVNLKTAAALGVAIPQSVLLRADEAIR
jgi:putative tryptophan/tyrosine transport system substrate-binding protein